MAKQSVGAGTAVVNAFYAAFGKTDVEAILATLDPKVSFELPSVPGMPLKPRYLGHRGFLRFLSDRQRCLAYDGFWPRQCVESAGSVVVLGETRGHALPRKRRFHFEWVEVFEIRRGRIVRFREFSDGRSLTRAFS